MNNTREMNLRADCLTFSEVLAQGIALISPTMTAALVIPLTFASAGEATWLAYLFATLMLLFVTFNLNQFASRSAFAGSMYIYTGRGLGPLGGALSGWCLIWAYLFIAMAGLTGFSFFANQILESFGLHIPTVILFIICTFAAWFFAYRDVQLSSILMLLLEGTSVALILLLAGVVIFKHGVIDSSQLSLQGISLPGLSLGVVACIFSLVGFEAPTAFGEEAKNPLKNIPKAMIWSLMLTGIFFIIVSYAEVLGMTGSKTTLDKVQAPLTMLADLVQLPFLKLPINLGAILSFFALTLSCLSAGSRILYPMGQHGVFHRSLSLAHPANKTPHIALTLLAILTFIVPTIMHFWQIQTIDAFGYVGTLGAFGFLAAYFLISLASPLYLHRNGWLRPSHIFLSVIAILFLLVPTIGSIYPVPAYPANIFPILFVSYFVVGLTWFLLLFNRHPRVIQEIRQDFEPRVQEMTK